MISHLRRSGSVGINQTWFDNVQECACVRWGVGWGLASDAVAVSVDCPRQMDGSEQRIWFGDVLDHPVFGRSGNVQW